MIGAAMGAAAGVGGVGVMVPAVPRRMSERSDWIEP